MAIRIAYTRLYGFRELTCFTANLRYLCKYLVIRFVLLNKRYHIVFCTSDPSLIPLAALILLKSCIGISPHNKPPAPPIRRDAAEKGQEDQWISAAG